MKLKPRATRITIIITLLVLAVVGYYAFLSSRAKDSRTEKSMSAIDTALTRDLDKDYPPTPKEVMKYYNSIIVCYYGEDTTEDDIEALGMKARGLFDAELAANNDTGTYLMMLKKEIQDNKDSKIRITNAGVVSSVNVDRYKRDGYEFARLACTYNVSDNGKSITRKTIYLLRKDSEKRWKIYGWDDESNVDLNGDGVKGD